MPSTISAAPGSDRWLTSTLTEWPESVPPMVVKELRQGLRARSFVVPFLLLQLVVAGLTLWEFLAVKFALPWLSGPTMGHMLFWSTAALAAALVLPTRVLGALAEELRDDNAQMILLAGQTRWRLIGGKWLAQMALAGLMLISLVPYGVLRYFFGGVELLANVAALFTVIGAASAMNALTLGASGYLVIGKRALIVMISLLFVGVLTMMLLAATSNVSTQAWQGGLTTVFVWLNGAVAAVGMTGFFTLTGLQLGRGKLRVAFRPWEVPPGRAVLVLFFLSPVIIGVGSAVTCGYGASVIVGLMIYWMWSVDRSG
jgi:hypothetical protein